MVRSRARDASRHPSDRGRRASSTTPSPSIRRLPLNYCGKLDIPTPWMKFLHDNKANWKVRAAKEEEDRRKAEAEKQALDNGDVQKNGDS
ncbi:3',5'-cyclic-nucleotide phosphodiesterase pde1 [Parelaphostrongylus tenuis]|uniref:3',5'-cyclic-nucleotide phosphodiesterase pde1 n=1 Tax=Parelaphostrongylus tenuis TaxID=148309 RepID=A0AAD5R0I8_PARTN|nr:3',5'-cyclic-nucleotide phosphodiesterase pde1 [Parelaphostrongylus tenuis]